MASCSAPEGRVVARSSRDFLRVNTANQILEWINPEGQVLQTYPVSTAKNGLGEIRGSECTPRGWHAIRAVIGRGLPENTIFRGRRPTGLFYSDVMETEMPGCDWILGRILWLGGLQAGYNRYDEVDTAWRYIYIHGAPDQGVDGTPQSHGCIRMRCDDVVDLADRVWSGLRVQIL